jgi:hypothetical protein
MLYSIDRDPTADPGGGKAKPPKRVPSAETIEWEVRDISRRYKRWRRTAIESALAVIDLGERIARLKRHIEAVSGYGHWTEFVEKIEIDFPALRTCQKFMAGAEAKDDPLLSTDAVAWLARIWGNKGGGSGSGQKRLKGASGKWGRGGTDSEGTEGDDPSKEDDEPFDNSQSGGPGFNPGFFPDQGKPAFTGFKNLARYLNEAFFESPAITTQEKLRFIEETVSWLEGRRKAIAAQIAQTE